MFPTNPLVSAHTRSHPQHHRKKQTYELDLSSHHCLKYHIKDLNHYLVISVNSQKRHKGAISFPEIPSPATKLHPHVQCVS